MTFSAPAEPNTAREESPSAPAEPDTAREESPSAPVEPDFSYKGMKGITQYF